MSYGHTFNEELRRELVAAVRAYETNEQNRAPLNAVIMKIEQPLLDKLDAIREIVKV